MAKKAFFVTIEDDDIGYGIIASSQEEAIKLSYDNNLQEETPEKWEPGCWEIPDADITGLKIGTIVRGIEGLRRGFCIWVEDDCPMCGKKTTIQYANDAETICCSDCAGKVFARMLNEGGDTGKRKFEIVALNLTEGDKEDE